MVKDSLAAAVSVTGLPGFALDSVKRTDWIRRLCGIRQSSTKSGVQDGWIGQVVPWAAVYAHARGKPGASGSVKWVLR